jgi:hypothetical protein
MSNADDFLDANGFEKHPTAKFPTIGTFYAGPIVDVPRVVNTVDKLKPVDPATGAKPRSDKLVINLADRQTGQVVTLWAKGAMLAAIKAAIDAASAKDGRTGANGYRISQAQGGQLVIKFVAEGAAPEPGMSPPKLFECLYVPPATPVAPTSADAALQAAPTVAPAGADLSSLING